jgi:ABC-type ATPase involved in cell division
VTDDGEALRLEGVHKSYEDLQVLKGIDLAVADHEVICLIGASGSGKSTMLKCVNLLEPIDHGRIFVEGEEITADGVDVNRIRRHIGIVFQAFNLFPHMTVMRNVTLAPMKVLGLSREKAETEAAELLRRFGLLDKKDEYPDRLSGGQQQRAAIARALAMNPQRPRPRARSRGAERDQGPGSGRHDDAHRHPRDGVRQGHRQSRVLLGRRGPPGRRTARPDLQRTTEPANQVLPPADHRSRPSVGGYGGARSSDGEPSDRRKKGRP